MEAVACAADGWAVPEVRRGARRSGASPDPRILGFVEEHYAKRCTGRTTSYFFEAPYGSPVSPSAVWNARRALGTCPRTPTTGSRITSQRPRPRSLTRPPPR